MKDKPLVTVYIPTYNRLELLKRAVQSVLNQDYKNIELIVVDDQSNDGTVEYLRQLSETNENVRYLVNIKNSGACFSRNRAIFSARGYFITGLDDDDYFLEKRISSFLYAWNNKQANTVAITSSVIIDFGNRKKKINRPKILRKNEFIFNASYAGSQVFTKTDYLKRISGFDERLKICQDFDCWLRLFDVFEDAAFETVRSETYVVDVSHEWERITRKNRDDITYSKKLIISKHDLSKFSKDIIMLDDNEKLCFSVLIVLIRKALMRPVKYNSKSVMAYFLRKSGIIS